MFGDWDIFSSIGDDFGDDLLTDIIIYDAVVNDDDIDDVDEIEDEIDNDDYIF